MSGTVARPDPILVALSGGVDSAVCVRILQEQGFAVQGLVIRFSPAHDGAVDAAQRAARELEIPLHIAEAHELFEKHVIAPFCEEYAMGRTPNPCIVCNPLVKFRLLCEKADELGIYYVATGHYARVEECEGLYYVAQPFSAARDQSYMLYRLPQPILKRLCLPLGEFEKDDIRTMAADAGLSSANAPDSQEICFIPDGNHPAYMAARGITAKQGCFISPEGENLGPHKGVQHYTVGQRRGTGLALGKPVFVKAILENGDVQLGWAGDEFSPSISLQDEVFVAGVPANGTRCLVKIRSMAKPVPCVLCRTADGILAAEFEEPQRAPAPGQSAVFYRNGLVLGGGIIRR